MDARTNVGSEYQACTLSSNDRIESFFADAVRGQLPKKRRGYCCSSCGETGHNKSKCTKLNGNLDTEEDEGIVPGEYTVGRCPFVDLQVHHVQPISEPCLGLNHSNTYNGDNGTATEDSSAWDATETRDTSVRPSAVDEAIV